MTRPSTGIIVAAAVTAIIVSLVTSRVMAVKPKPRKTAAAAIAQQSESLYDPRVRFMRFTAIPVQARPNLIVVSADLDLWAGEKLSNPIPGNDGVRLEVSVYAPDDPSCEGGKVSTAVSKKYAIGPMKVPILGHEILVLDVPASQRPYWVVVQTIGGLEKNPPAGVVSKARIETLPVLRPVVFSAKRMPARIGF